MKKNILKLLLISLATSAIIGGCGNSAKDPVASEQTATSEQPAQSTETTEPVTNSNQPFIYAIDSDPGTNINPVTSDSRYNLTLVNMVFSPLYRFDGEPQLILAEDVSVSDDSLTYSIKIKEGVTFHDGTPLTSKDVKFTFDTILTDPASSKHSSMQFGGSPLVVEIVDDYNLEFKLTSPKANALEVFGDTYIMPEHIYKDVESFETSSLPPVGSGAYKYVEYKEGESTTLQKYEDYFLGEPNIDTIILKVILDANTSILALQKGEVTALSINPADVEKINADEITVYPYSEGRIGYLSFNFGTTTGNEAVNNKDFRAAVFNAINKEDILIGSYLSEEFSFSPISFLPSTSTFVSEDIEAYGLNVDKAKELLAKSGVTNPSLKLGYIGNNPVYQTQAAIIQDNLATIGVNCELIPLDGTAMFKDLANRNGAFDMYFGGYIMSIDPDGYSPLFTTDSPSNYSAFSSKKIDDLFLAGINENDDEKRAEIYQELQEEFANEAFFLPLTENKRIMAISNNVTGIDEAELVPIHAFQYWNELSFK